MTSLTGRKSVVALAVFVTSTFFLLSILQDKGTYNSYYELTDEEAQPYTRSNWRQLSKEQVQEMSTLGRILFLDEPPPLVNSAKRYKILMWNYGPMLERRHFNHFTNKTFDPFAKCSVNNCDITYKSEDANHSDIVVIHMQRTKGPDELPKRAKPEQIFAFLSDESAYHIFLNPNKLASYNGLFNWSMTYRMTSDIPVPYGRTVPLTYERPFTKADAHSWYERKSGGAPVAIMGSNCASKNNRWKYVSELKKDVPVDMYGKCGTLKCSAGYSDCPTLAKYKFYLAFENCNCDEYITEKVWWNSYQKEAIPIVMGASAPSYKQSLPPGSYINVEDFATPRDLAAYLKYLNEYPDELYRYLKWKRHFKVLNEHGYAGSDSFHYCRICEALNYNSRKEKVYNDLEKFMSVASECHPSWTDHSNEN